MVYEPIDTAHAVPTVTTQSADASTPCPPANRWQHAQQHLRSVSRSIILVMIALAWNQCLRHGFEYFMPSGQRHLSLKMLVVVAIVITTIGLVWVYRLDHP
jgi:uncharacterized membrane protein